MKYRLPHLAIAIILLGGLGGAHAVSAQPPPIIYFSNDMEGDVTGWTTTGTWAVTSETSHSGSKSWSDSPGGPYPAPSSATLMTPPIDLSSAVNPRLTFWQTFQLVGIGEDIIEADTVNVSVIKDNGQSASLKTSYCCSPWAIAQFDLTPFVGNHSLRVEFTLSAPTAKFGRADGWHIDDVVVTEERTEPPDAFGKSAPANGQTVQETTPTIQWAESGAATFYEYCVDTTNNDTCDGTWRSTNKDTSASLTGLARNTAYWWQVRARNIIGTTQADAGMWWTFTMGGVPSPFSKTMPDNGAKGRPATPTLSWTSSTGTDGYEYCVDTTNNNTCNAVWTSTAATSVELNVLAGATTYWWQVRARNTAGAVEANGGTWWAFTTAVRTNDFDGDGKTDVAIFRASTGGWHMLQSSTTNTTSVGVSWGLSTDQPMPGDYDGDGKTDPTIFRPSTGLWAILKSSTNYASATYVSWGLSTDVPVPADYDGDTKTDPAIYRPSTGLWAMLKSSNSYASATYVFWGLSTDVPMQSDYDGDGKADPTVFRPSTGGWYVLKSSTTYGSSFGVLWGLSTDVPVPGDYDGDGKTDPAVFRASTGGWFILHSHTNYTTSAGTSWGASGDVPVPGDFDGDGKTDFAVFTASTGVWSILKSADVGLAHWWQLDEASGTVASDAAGDGTTDGALGSGAHPVSGHVGPGALQFDAFDTNGYVNIPRSVTALGTSDFTISFWMIKTPDPTSWWGTLVGDRGNLGYYGFVQFYADDSSITLEMKEDGSSRGYLRLDSGVLSIANGQWHRITGVRSGPTMWLYVDGVIQATGTAADGFTANLMATWFDFTVGVNEYERSHPELNCGCRFDDVQIYHRALSAHDIQSGITDVNVSWGLSTDVPIGRRQ